MQAGMQSVKRLVTRRCRHSLIQCKRSLSSLPINSCADDLQNQVLVEGKASSRIAILNRPSSLNALNTNIGSGRAFCAGGDIVALYHLINEGKMEEYV